MLIFHLWYGLLHHDPRQAVLCTRCAARYRACPEPHRGRRADCQLPTANCQLFSPAINKEFAETPYIFSDVFWLPRRIPSEVNGPAQAFRPILGCFGADSTVTVLSSAVIGESASGLDKQIGQIRLQIAVELPLQPGGVRWRRGGIVLATAAASAAPGLGWRLRFGLGLLAGVDGGGVAADVSGDLPAVVGFDQRLVNLLRPTIASEGVEFRPPAWGKAMTGCCATTGPSGFGVVRSACAVVSLVRVHTRSFGSQTLYNKLRCNNLQLFSVGGGGVDKRSEMWDTFLVRCGRGMVPCRKQRGVGWGVRWAHGGQRGSSTYKTPRSQAGLCVHTGRQAGRRSDRGVLQEPPRRQCSVGKPLGARRFCLKGVHMNRWVCVMLAGCVSGMLMAAAAKAEP